MAMQTTLWILGIATIWLLPLAAYVFEHQLFTRLLAMFAKGAQKKSLPVQLFLLAFVTVLVIHGGAKQARSGDGHRQSCDTRAGDCFVPRNDGEWESRTNGLWISGFAVNGTSVSFELSWSDAAFDDALSRNIDLFASTNLTSSWCWCNRYAMPVGTNQHAFSVGGDFGKRMFFTFGLDVDTDEDGLTDAYEQFVSGTSPTSADSDGDGMPDAWEIENGLNPNDANDAYDDPDGDGVPNSYEYIHGGNPHVADACCVPKIIAGDTSVSNGVATLKQAFDMATPYSIIEIADGVYTGTGWCGLYLPTNQVLITSANGGKSRGAVINNTSSVATFFMDDYQTSDTIIQGLRLVLSGSSNIQAAFWIGAPSVFQTGTASAVFRNIDITFAGSASGMYGWYFLQYQEEPSIISGCRINAKGNTSSSVRGIWLVDYAPLFIENCTFLNFPTDTPAILCQSITYATTPAPDGVPVEIVNCHFDKSFTNAYPLARLEAGSEYVISMSNCVMPCEMYYKYVPDYSENLFYTNAPVSHLGSIADESFLMAHGMPSRYSVFDIDGQPWRNVPSIGADEYYAITDMTLDSDCDGLTDYQEVYETHTSPFISDWDMDGRTDGEEIADGTNPLDANSHFMEAIVEIPDTTIWSGETNYLIVASASDSWIGDIDNVVFTGGYTNVYNLTSHEGNVYFKFFRDVNSNGVYDAGIEFLRVKMMSRNKIFMTVDFDLDEDFDHDHDGIYDCWELTHGMSPDNGNDKWYDPDNDGLLNLHEYWLDSNPRLYDQTNSVIQLFTKSIDDRLMMNATSNEVALVLPKFENYTTNNFSLNTNFWLRDVDTSSVSMWTDQLPWRTNEWSITATSQRSGVAISKRHVLQADHWSVEIGSELLFYGTDGIVYTNSIMTNAYVAGDIRIGVLTHELPDTVSVAKIMPTNFFNYIGNAIRIPMIFFDQLEEARILEMAEMEFSARRFWYLGTRWYPGKTANANREHYCKTIIGGDSGSPFFFLAGDQLVLVGVAWTNGNSNFAGFFTHQIQAAMDSLLPEEQARHRLQIFDFSPYSQIIPERIQP